MKNNIMLQLIAVLMMAAVLQSCALGNKYTRTKLDLPANYRDEIPMTGDTILLPWRTFFRDQELSKLIGKALEKNNDAAIALKSVEQTELAFKQAKLALLPAIEANAGFNRTYPSKNSLNGSLTEQFTGTKYIDDFNAGLGLSWEADIWGKAKMQQDQARANYFTQKENLSALKTSIIAQVAQAYYNLVSLDAQLRIAQENVALSDSTLQMMRLQYNSGLINSVAIEQAEAQKKTAELIIPLALQNITIQENAISILCGEYPERIIRTNNFNVNTPEDSFPAGLPAQLISRRPDVRAAEYAVVSLNAQTGLSKAAMYPTFGLTAQAGANSFKFRSWFDLPGSLAKNVALNLTQPIFQRGALKTALKTARIEQEKAVIQFKQTVLTAVGEVSNALARVKGAGSRLELVRQRGASYDKATKDAILLYKAGMATYLEVITAQNGKLQNDLDQIEIKLEEMNSNIELYRALGGGVD